MRKLLVASQKGGVGKTTTAINLAAAAARAGVRVLLLDADPLGSISAALTLNQHPRRQALRPAGIELPGVLVGNVIPGLDIVSPYEDGSCTDEELDDLLKVLASPEVTERYGCLIVGSPPFMGANAAQLLGTCDDFVIVMRAEAMAYRTLPAFLELVQRNKHTTRPIHLSGILLTLPEPDAQGERWERELRGRFGNRILANVITYDEEVRKALDLGQIVMQSAPESSAATQYKQLAEGLSLLKDAKKADLRAEAPLLEIATSMQAAGLLTPRRAAVPVLPSGAAEDVETLIEPAIFREEPEVPAYRPPVGPPSKAKVPSNPSRSGSKAKAPPATMKVEPPVPEPTPAAKTQPAANGSMGLLAGQPWIVWIGLAAAAVIGVGLRFMPKMPDFMLPLVIGTLVTAGVVLALKLVFLNAEKNLDGKEETPLVTKPASRTDLRKDSRSRIATPARHRREPRFKRDR